MAGRGDRKNSAQNSTSLTNHPMLDPVTLHMAYLAAQLRSLQEQNQLASSVFTKSPLSLTDCLSALTNCSVNNLYNAPMGQRLHSFSELTNHLSGRSTTALDAINLATTSIPQTSQQYSTLDMMLQMQMVAATGLMPQTINFLPPASSLSGLLGHPLSCAPNMPGLTPNPASFNNLGLSLASEPPSLNQIAITESSKIDWAQECLGNLLPKASINQASSDRLCYSIACDTSKSTDGSPKPHLELRTYSLGRKETLKRPTTEANTLKQLCNEEEESAPFKKRFKKFSFDETIAAGSSNHLSRTDGIQTMASRLKDYECPNRHHPINHRPPAIEARFLECMAAIALHSDFPLLSLTNIKDQDEKEQEQGADENDTAKSRRQPCELKSQISTDDEKPEKDTESPCNSGNGGASKSADTCTDLKKDDNTLGLWSSTAVDEELYEKFETCRGPDIPVIHAYVLPSEANEEKAGEESLPVQSLAVPLPVVNMLLDRILKTMLVES